MMKRLTEKRIAEILSRAEVCDDSVLTDYADIAAAMREIQEYRKASVPAVPGMENNRLTDERIKIIATWLATECHSLNLEMLSCLRELQERRKAEAVQSNVNIKPFTREQLITEAKQAVKGCERLLRISPDVEAHKISLRMAEIALAALTENPASVVPHGWKLVPQEPTDEMIEAMHGVDGYWEEDITSSLRDAIAAAPQPPVNDLPGGGTGEEYLDHLLDNPK